MPVEDLMMDGVRLMVLGMGIVFSFLVILVLAMTAMSWLAGRIQPQSEPLAPLGIAAKANIARRDPDPATIAAIGAAVAMFRRKHK